MDIDKQATFEERAAATDRTAAETGQMGESLAVKWLRANGYMIHHTNWRDGRYELDIVASKLGVIHFIEVKTRKFGGLTTPEDAMTLRKEKAFLKAAKSYFLQYGVKYDIQYDLIAIDTLRFEAWRVRLIENIIHIRM